MRPGLPGPADAAPAPGGAPLARESALPLRLRLAINRPLLSLDEYWEICRGYEDACKKRLGG